MANKQKLPTIITPVGVAKFIHVNKPNTKFHDDGVFSVDLVLEGADADQLRDSLQELAEAARKEMAERDKKPVILKYELVTGFGDNLDKDGNDAGGMLFKFKNKAVYRPKDGEPKNIIIPIYDSRKKPLDGVMVGHGSKVRVAFEAAPFAMPATKKAGLTLRLKAVQVVDLKSYTERSADSYGFGEEDGYAQEQELAPSDVSGGDAAGDANY
jgi:hypothetical protein